MRFAVPVAVFVCLYINVASGKAPILSRYELYSPSSALLEQIAQKFEIESRTGDRYRVIVPETEAGQLRTMDSKAVLIDRDLAAALRQKIGKHRFGWHNLETVQTHLDKIASEHPDMALVEKIGESKEGRPIKALRLLSIVPVRQTRGQVVITGATHGDELMGTEVVFGLLELLVSNYGKDSRLTALVDNHELYFVPVVNADGYYYGERYANGVDPNRDYPWPSDPNHISNPAVKTMMDFFAAHEIVGSIDYHTAAGVIMYPWGYTKQSLESSLATILEQLTSKMASLNGYSHGQISKVLYIAQGSSADYYCWKFKTKALGIEISQDGSSTLIPKMIEENAEPTWAFVEAM